MQKIILNNSQNINIKLKLNKLNYNIYIYFLLKNNLISYYNLGKNIYVLNNNKLFLKKQSFYLLKSLLNTNKNLLLNGFYSELNLKGIGFSFFIINNYLYIDLGYSHYIGIKIIKNLIIKRFKTRLIIYGYSKSLINNFIKKLLILRKFNIYKGKGIFYKNTNIKLKEGKKR